VPGYLTTGKRIAYVRLRPLFASRGDNARPSFETARCQWDIGGDANVEGRDVLCNPVTGRVCSVADHSASLDCDRERLALPNEHYEAFAACHAIVHEVPLQHRVVFVVSGMTTAGYSEPWLMWIVAA
jgi:hypothetical protein